MKKMIFAASFAAMLLAGQLVNAQSYNGGQYGHGGRNGGSGNGQYSNNNNGNRSGNGQYNNGGRGYNGGGYQYGSGHEGMNNGGQFDRGRGERDGFRGRDNMYGMGYGRRNGWDRDRGFRGDDRRREWMRERACRW